MITFDPSFGRHFNGGAVILERYQLYFYFFILFFLEEKEKNRGKLLATGRTDKSLDNSTTSRELGSSAKEES